MALINPLQPTFSGGEFSPSIHPRVDIEKYRTGLKTCRNFIIHPHGGASNRPGTKYMATAKHATKLSIVRSFIFSSTEAYILELGDLYIRFFTDQAQIQADVSEEWLTTNAYAVNDYVTYNSVTYRSIQIGTFKRPDIETDYWTEQQIYEIVSPYLEADLLELEFESSADVIYITHPDYQTRTLSRYGNADWRLELYAPTDGPFMSENTAATTISCETLTATTTLTASSALFQTTHVGALWKVRHYIEGQTNTSAFAGTGTGTAIRCFTTWRIITHGTWTGKIRVEKSSDEGVTWTTLRSFSSADDYNASTSGTEDVELNTEPFQVRLNMYAYTSGTCNADLTTDAFYQEGIINLQTYNSATSITGTVTQTIGSIAATTSWSEGSWSDYRGYPSVSRFYQDRLCFAGSPSEPMTTWMTETGDYTSFLRHSPLLDTDGITINLPSRQLNAINGLVALKKLLSFTSTSEWGIGSSSGVALTPLNNEQTVEGYRGSYGVNPVVVGNEIIYVQANGKVMRNFGYELGSDGFAGAELNILAKHLFDKWNIVDLAYQQDPDSIVWALRDDGILLGMTYMREQEVVAWFWADTGTIAGNDTATINSVATIPGDGYDELWMSVTRGNSRFIELMSQRIVEADCVTGGKKFLAEKSYFVDCGRSFGDNALYITNISLTVPIKITAQAHGFTDDMIVRIDNVPEYPDLEGTAWTINNATANTFELTTEVV